MLLSGCDEVNENLKTSDDYTVYDPKEHIYFLFQQAFGGSSMFQTIRAVATFAGLVALALAGLKLIASDNPRDAQIAKTWIISVLIGLAMFWWIPKMFGILQIYRWFPH